MPAMRVCVPGSQYSFSGPKEFLFLSPGQGVYIFEDNPKSNQDVIGCLFCPGEYVSTERNANLFMVVESVELGYLFTKFLLSYKNT